jgi:hypothetical protein
MNCPPSDELLDAIAGGAFPHADECKTCRDELAALRALAQELGAPTEQDVEDAQQVSKLVLAKVREAATPRRAIVTRWVAPLALAAAAVIAVGVRYRSETDVRARGAGTSEAPGAALARRTGITLYRLEGGKPIAIQRGDKLAAGTVFVAGYRNIDKAGNEYFTALLVDAKGETHWLYPGFTDPNEAPTSIKLNESIQETLLSSSVSFDDLPPGDARILMLRTREPVDVRTLDQIKRPTLTALSSRFADSVVDELHVTF